MAPRWAALWHGEWGIRHWRVAALYAEGEQGDWSTTSRMVLAKGLKLAGDTNPVKGKSLPITVAVTNVKGAPVVSGHFLPEENPEVTVRLLREFL
mgnify:CR=1 FL=1